MPSILGIRVGTVANWTCPASREQLRPATLVSAMEVGEPEVAVSSVIFLKYEFVLEMS